MKLLRRIFRSTPLHPQWLLNFSRDSSTLIEQARGSVLDIGSAERWIEGAIDKSCSYVALDYPATGGRLYGSLPDVFADAAHLPFAKEVFDNVVMFEVLEHVAEPRMAVSEAYRILKPGGKLLLTMPFLYPMHDEPYDFQRFTQYGLERELRRSGFEVVSLQPAQNAIESAGLLLALALGGAGLQAFQKRHPGILLLPGIVIAIVVVNITCWSMGRLLPDWSAFTKGWHVTAIKRATKQSGRKP